MLADLVRGGTKSAVTPGIELGTSGLGSRDLNHCANPSVVEYGQLLCKSTS